MKDKKNTTNISIQSLIPAALMYFDSNNHQHEAEYKQVRNTHMELSRNDVDPSIIELFDKNNNSLKRCTFQIIGRYHKKTQYFYWSWADHLLPKHLTKVSRKIFNYGTNIKLEHTYIQRTLENPIVAKNMYNSSSANLYEYKLEEPILDGEQTTIKGTIGFSKLNDHLYQNRLKENFINSQVYISNIPQLDMLIALSMYLSKNPNMYKFSYGNNIIWYVILLNDVGTDSK